LPESIGSSFSGETASTLETGVIGCVFPTDAGCVSAIERLRALDEKALEIHVGALTPSRAQEIAQRTGVLADISPEDPLHGMKGYAGQAAARRAVDSAGVWGAAVGAVTGFFVGRAPFGHLVPVAAPLQPLADTLLFFVIGLFIGSILGGAFAPQQSSHAAFRLIDGMHDGSLALIVIAPKVRVEEATRLLEEAGGTGLSQL
jgi:hypothetical protein